MDNFDDNINNQYCPNSMMIPMHCDDDDQDFGLDWVQKASTYEVANDDDDDRELGGTVVQPPRGASGSTSVTNRATGPLETRLWWKARAVHWSRFYGQRSGEGPADSLTS